MNSPVAARMGYATIRRMASDDVPTSVPRLAEPEVMDLDAEVRAYACADFAEVNAAFVERLLAVAGPRSAVQAVDLGTGPGDIPLRVASARPGWRITAVDASEAMLRWARSAVVRAGVADRIRLVRADAKTLPFAAGTFDVVFSNSILHHLSSPERLWSEIRRVGRPGAAVFVRDLARPADAKTAWQIVRQYAARESSLLQEECYRSLRAAYQPDEVRDQLRAAGLRTLEVANVTDRHLDVFGCLESGCLAKRT